MRSKSVRTLPPWLYFRFLPWIPTLDFPSWWLWWGHSKTNKKQFLLKFLFFMMLITTIERKLKQCLKLTSGLICTCEHTHTHKYTQALMYTHIHTLAKRVYGNHLSETSWFLLNKSIKSSLVLYKFVNIFKIPKLCSTRMHYLMRIVSNLSACHSPSNLPFPSLLPALWHQSIQCLPVLFDRHYF